MPPYVKSWGRLGCQVKEGHLNDGKNSPPLRAGSGDKTAPKVRMSGRTRRVTMTTSRIFL